MNSVRQSGSNNRWVYRAIGRHRLVIDCGCRAQHKPVRQAALYFGICGRFVARVRPLYTTGKMISKGNHMNTARHSRATSFKFFIGAVASLLLLTSLGVCAADLYRWTDSRGVVHYTDKPPHGVNAENLSVKKAVSLSNPRIDSAEETTETTANPDTARCQAERARLAILEKNNRIQMESRDGTVKELSDAEIQQEREFSQRAVERFCKPQQPSSD